MDSKELYELLNKFDKSSLSEITVKEGESEIVMKKIVQAYQSGTTAEMYPHPQARPHLHGMHAPSPHEAEVPVEEPLEDGHETITSPIVGTFYRSAAPDAPPFIEVGSKVNTGETLCIIEAMKVMNKLEAEFNCEIVNILVQNSEMVEYGTPLFEVKRL